MKKVLLISSTELSTYQMLTYIKQNKKKCNVDYLICNKYKKVFNRNFKSLQKKTIYYDPPQAPIFFNLLKFWNIFQAKTNKLAYKKIIKQLSQKSFSINDYDEVYFSNESISYYLLYNSNVKKFFFTHSPIDNLLIADVNLIKKMKKFIENFINNKIMCIYQKNNTNFFIKSIFFNFLKKKHKKQLLSIRIFKKIFSKYNKYDVKKKNHFNYNLINFAMPYYVYNYKYSDFLIKDYTNFFFNNILNRVFSKNNKQDILLFKFRNNIPINFQINIIKLIKKKFPKKKIILVNKTFPELKTLESVILNFKIKKYFTTFSSSVYLGKILNKKILIYDYTFRTREFWKKYWHLMKTKNNYNNYPHAIKLYKNPTYTL